MSLKRAAYDSLNRGPGRRLVGIAASADAMLHRRPTWISYDRMSQTWRHRSREGFTLMPEPRGQNAAECDAATREIFMYRYTVRPGDIVLDIGAGTGTETLAFSRSVGDRGRLVAVEAHPATHAVLARLVELNRLCNVVTVQAALMDSAEPVTISDLPAESSHENHIGSEGVTVPALILPDLVRTMGLPHIDFLKMNIEGAETAALRGAREVLHMVRHAAIGCHDFLADESGDDTYRTKDAVRSILVDAGFDVVGREGDRRPWIADYLFASR